MSFLIRRNLPLAWAGWRDTFDRPPENPLQRPWRHLGGGESYINNLEELVVTEQAVNSDGRGPSYEWQPFTPNWGFEAELWYPVSGADNQHFYIVFTDSWVRIGSDLFQKAVGVGFKHELGGFDDNIVVGEFPDMFTPINLIGTWDSPVGSFNGKTLTVRVWCDNDAWLRIWLNNSYVGSVMPTEAYKLSPLRRCVRLVNRSYCNVYIRWINHYDRPSSIPPKTVWSSIFYDDFNRADGAAGNGWTQLGTDAGIVSNRYVHTGSNNNSVGLTRNVGNLNGRARIEAVVRSPSTASDSGLMLCMNAAGDQALTANIFSGQVYLGRVTSSVNGTPSFYDFSNRGVTVADGDKLAFSVYDGVCWLEINGTPALYAGNVHDVVPSTNAYAGLRVERDGSNSAAFDDVRIYSGVGI
ncbi:hypothetical protein [Nocardia thailandica]|uniref:hypothetical protein n=1 Tax=Nocardia thailandica TaxID=257275 RepID=UPI000315CC9C|nr:hypothetical protein [Nocardia thailandica]